MFEGAKLDKYFNKQTSRSLIFIIFDKSFIFAQYLMKKFSRVIFCVLFFLSGISALFYQTVWFRMLSRIIGNTNYALAMILTAFMAGLMLGSFFIGKINLKFSALKQYAVVEILLGLSIMPVFWALQNVQYVFIEVDTIRNLPIGGLYLVQSVVCFVILLIPTVLMGSTLPLLSGYLCQETDKNEEIAYLYGWNTAGSVVGVLLSGFILIGWVGERTTLCIGLVINLLVGLWAYLIYLKDKNKFTLYSIDNEGTSPNYSLLIINFILGFTAIGFETVWNRILQPYLGTTIYTFSLILAFYLMGISLGSLVMNRMINYFKSIGWLFILTVLGIMLFCTMGIYILLIFNAVHSSGYSGIENTIKVLLFVVFSPTFAMGACFSLLLNLLSPHNKMVTKEIGRFYAMNTLGCILGAVFCGIILPNYFESKTIILVLLYLNAIVVFIAYYKFKPIHYQKFILVVFGIVGIGISGYFSPDPWKTAVYKWQEKVMPNSSVLYHKETPEGVASVIASNENPNDRRLLINALSVAGLGNECKLMAYLPLLLHPKPEKMLTVCFGMGNCVRSALKYPIESCQVIEIVPETFKTARFFDKDTGSFLKDSRLQKLSGDGRNFLLFNKQQYDVISIDPSPPLWAASATALQTQEFFQLCSSRLSQNGILCYWFTAELYSEMSLVFHTFRTVFPNALIYASAGIEGFYLIGSNQPILIDNERFIKADSNQTIVQDINEWGTPKFLPSQIPSKLLLNTQDINQFLPKTPIITDDLPLTEFSLWRRIKPQNQACWLNPEEILKWKNNTSNCYQKP